MVLSFLQNMFDFKKDGNSYHVDFLNKELLNGEVPNPMNDVIQSFLSLRSKYKKMMFSYPKGSEFYERYNLQQQLSKIDANGIAI